MKKIKEIIDAIKTLSPEDRDKVAKALKALNSLDKIISGE